MLEKTHGTRTPALTAYKLKIAAEKGSAQANYDLATMYESGKLGENSRSVAILYYKRAGRAQHARAIEKIVNYYTEGKQVAPNVAKAEKWKNRLSKNF